MTKVWNVGKAWYAMWNGEIAKATFNSEGAARAWVNVCNAKGRYHS